MHTDTFILISLMVAAYLLGSVPTGLLLGNIYGVDVRKEGSGNIGATNLYRTVGRKIGIITLACDCLKGFVPVMGFKLYVLPVEFAAWIGLVAFCGHVFSVFLGFKGGKGVATALGVFLALSPLAVGIAVAVFVVFMLIWRYVSLGSVAAAVVMPVAVIVLQDDKSIIVATLIISLTVIARHSENIRRLLAGTESKFKA